MADIFISYAREDKAFAERIAHGLSGMGLDVFWDSEIPPGQTWADYIESKLAQCRSVIVLWSQHSVKSQWVREEARMGREKAKLIPVLLDGSPAPFGFGEVQAADLSAWTGDPNQQDWQRFSQAVYSAARGSAPPPQNQIQQAAWSAPPQAQAQSGWTTPTPQSQARWSGAASTGAGQAEQPSPIGYIQKCLRLYLDGKGRARRAEYWWWVAFSVVVSIVATSIDLSFGMNAYGQPNSQVMSMLAGLALLGPGVSVMARRFHDVGLSGWLVAGVFAANVVGGFLAGMQNPIGLVIAGVAAVAALVVTLMPSKPGANQYGPNPKGL